MKSFLRKCKDERGSVLVMFAFFLVALLSVGALAVDIATVQLAKTRLQDAADAAALAGARALPNAGSATEAALAYAAFNGVSGANVTVTTPYQSDSNRVQVVCTQQVQYYFAKVLGFNGKTVSARAVAEKTGNTGGPFDYAVFSGSSSHTLTMNGSNTNITGNAHSNYKFTINGSSQYITGSAEAVSSFRMNGSNQSITGTCRASDITTNGSNIVIGNRIESPAPWIAMPDFSDVIQAEAEAAGQSFFGNKTYNGSYINVDTPIYVQGNLTVNGSNFTGKGIILVSGSITFNGSNLSSTGAAVCFYSETGNITINGSNIQLHGIVYAPNGSITMNGSNQTVRGRVVGNRVLFNGSNYNIIAGPGDLDSLSSGGVHLVE